MAPKHEDIDRDISIDVSAVLSVLCVMHAFAEIAARVNRRIENVFCHLS